MREAASGSDPMPVALPAVGNSRQRRPLTLPYHHPFLHGLATSPSDPTTLGPRHHHSPAQPSYWPPPESACRGSSTPSTTPHAFVPPPRFQTRTPSPPPASPVAPHKPSSPQSAGSAPRPPSPCQPQPHPWTLYFLLSCGILPACLFPPYSPPRGPGPGGPVLKNKVFGYRPSGPVYVACRRGLALERSSGRLVPVAPWSDRVAGRVRTAPRTCS